MFGVSRARLTRYLNLLKLPQRIVAFLGECEDETVLRYFTEHRLRQLTSLGYQDEVIPRFREMVQDAVPDMNRRGPSWHWKP